MQDEVINRVYMLKYMLKLVKEWPYTQHVQKTMCISVSLTFKFYKNLFQNKVSDIFGDLPVNDYCKLHWEIF